MGAFDVCDCGVAGEVSWRKADEGGMERNGQMRGTASSIATAPRQTRLMEDTQRCILAATLEIASTTRLTR